MGPGNEMYTDRLAGLWIGGVGGGPPPPDAIHSAPYVVLKRHDSSSLQLDRKSLLDSVPEQSTPAVAPSPSRGCSPAPSPPTHPHSLPPRHPLVSQAVPWPAVETL